MLNYTSGFLLHCSSINKKVGENKQDKTSYGFMNFK